MNTLDTPRFCLSCNKPLRGRTDKKFCDDYCRNSYHNHLKADTNNLVRKINNGLTKNRRILQSLMPDGDEMVKVSKNKLLENGFQFKFHTHMHVNPKGSHYVYCYDYGYLTLDTENLLIVKDEDN